MKMKYALTRTKDRRGDLDLTCSLVRLEGWDTVGAELTAEYLWALSTCGAGTGAITSMMWVLLIKPGYQLEMTGEFAVIYKGIWKDNPKLTPSLV